MQVDPAVTDRITKALNFEEPDRVPIWESLQNGAVYEHFAPGVPFPECAAIACAELGIDATYGCMAPVQELGDVGGMVHAGGTVWGVDPVFRSLSDLRDHRSDEPDAAAIEEQTLAGHERMQELYGPRVMYLPQCGGCGLLPGYDTQTFTVVATAIQEDISALKRFWDSRVEHAVTWSEVIARHRLAPVVQYCEDVAFKTGLMVSRDLLQQEFFPRMKRIIAPLKAVGIKAIWHSDGDITDVLDDAVDCGFDGINPVDPSAGMDIGAIRKRFGRKLILVGNVGADHVLSRGTPDEVRADVRRCLRDAGGGGGHLLQCGDGQVMPDCPLENVIAYCEEARRSRGSV